MPQTREDGHHSKGTPDWHVYVFVGVFALAVVLWCFGFMYLGFAASCQGGLVR